MLELGSQLTYDRRNRFSIQVGSRGADHDALASSTLQLQDTFAELLLSWARASLDT